ncbi:hypothetical protein RB600_005329 [Gaeumannomyces tritici]
MFGWARLRGTSWCQHVRPPHLNRAVHLAAPNRPPGRRQSIQSNTTQQSEKRITEEGRWQTVRVANVEDEDTTRLAEFQLEPGRYTHLIVKEKENEEEKEKEKVEDKDNLEADSSPEDNTGAVSSPKDTTGPEKYDLPQKAYEEMSNTFLAFKKAKELGRFDPKAPGKAKARVAAHAREAADRGIEPGRRCHIEDPKVLLYGVVRYVGDVPEIPDPGFWVGVQLDEPLGRNDGSIGGKRYWGEAGSLNYGMFVRPARIEIGDFRPLNDLEGDPDREEM